MSENWNAWNPNKEDDDDEELFAAQQESAPPEIDWGEVFSNKKEEEDKDTDIFSSKEGEGIFGKLIESADEADGEEAGAETEDARPEAGDQSPIIAEGEAESLQEQVDSSEEPQAEQPDSAQPEAGAVENESETEGSATETEDSDSPEQGDDIGDEHEGELAEDSVLEIEKPQPAGKQEQEDKPDNAAEIENNAAEEEQTEEESPEQPDAETEDARPEAGDQSPIIAEGEAEALQEQFDSSEDPDETILEEPTVLEEEPGEVYAEEHEDESKPEDEEPVLEEASDTDDEKSSKTRTRYRTRRPFSPVIGSGRGPDMANASSSVDRLSDSDRAIDDSITQEGDIIPVQEANNVRQHETEAAETDNNQEDSVETEETGTLQVEHDREQDEKAEAEAARETEAEEDDTSAEEENENTEDLVKAAALSAAAFEAGRQLHRKENEEDQAGNDELPIANQELSAGSSQEQYPQAAAEEVHAESLNRNDEIDWHDPEAATFDTRQEVLNRQPDDKPTVQNEYLPGDAQGDAVPISDILQTRGTDLQADSGMNELLNREDLMNPASPHSGVSAYKSAIIMGVIAAFAIIGIIIAYLIYK